MILVLMALAARSSSIAGLAEDILIGGISTGRINAQKMEDAIRILWKMNLTDSFRWSKNFKTVIRESTTHAEIIFDALQQSIDSWGYNDSGPFLELLYELAFQLQRTITNENCRKYLQSRRGNNKAANYAKMLLALE